MDEAQFQEELKNMIETRMCFGFTTPDKNIEIKKVLGF